MYPVGTWESEPEMSGMEINLELLVYRQLMSQETDYLNIHVLIDEKQQRKNAKEQQSFWLRKENCITK